MKFLILFLLTGLVACSSNKDKATDAPAKVTNESFKKEKPLSDREMRDFYSANVKALSPALQDETVDRYTPEEMSQVSDPADPLLTMAVMCSKGEFDPAFGIASKSFNKYQKVPGYWNQVANCHLNMGNSRKALLFYNKALEVSPDYVPTLNNIGVMYSRQGQDQKALVAFERANKNAKFSKTPRYNLAKLYLTYGLADEALPIFKALLSDSPQDVDLQNSVASAHFLMSNYQEAAQNYVKIPAEQLYSAEVGLNFALTLNKLGKQPEAIKVFNAVKEPSAPELKRYYSIVKAQLGERK
ncbi:MAG TPA: tetratricopeptide repeat protein [Bacteriovoracaceae bacterium]|nr:tetratricopeptide repeat protein [Bacteriovoracaceae bacterium]